MNDHIAILELMKDCGFDYPQSGEPLRSAYAKIYTAPLTLNEAVVELACTAEPAPLLTSNNSFLRQLGERYYTK